MHKSHIYKFLSIICFIIAIGCIAYEPIKSRLVLQYHPKITRQSITRPQRPQQKRHVSYNMNQVKPATMTGIINARDHSNNVSVAGQILVPSVGLHLPINRGVSNEALLLGAGTMRPNMPMGKGNYALAGHHMINKQALFTPLWYHAHRGTNIYITNMRQVYIYRINQRRIISPYDVRVVNNTRRPMITLITCNDSGSQRLLLQGNLVKTTALSAMPALMQKLINSNTNNHDVLKGY